MPREEMHEYFSKKRTTLELKYLYDQLRHLGKEERAIKKALTSVAAYRNQLQVELLELEHQQRVVKKPGFKMPAKNTQARCKDTPVAIKSSSLRVTTQEPGGKVENTKNTNQTSLDLTVQNPVRKWNYGLECEEKSEGESEEMSDKESEEKEDKVELE